MSQPYRRGRLWVDPPFQGRLLLRMALSLLLFMLLIWHVGFCFEAMATLSASASMPGLGQLYVNYFKKQIPLLFTLFLFLPPMMYNLLKFSNRIAGPLFRCRRVMREMAAGKKVNEFVPRQGDFMGELFAAFNELIRASNARVETPPEAATDKATAPIAPSARQEVMR